MTGPRRRAGRTLVWTWRVWMLAYLGSAVAQPVLAGAYLEGDYDAIGWHGTNGSALLSAMVVGTALLALGCAVVARTAWWPVLLAGVLVVVHALQIGWGHTRDLLLHVPVGVAIVAAVAGLTLWVWSPSLPARRGNRT